MWEEGVESKKAHSGKFNVRVPPRLHATIASAATAAERLNTLAAQLISGHDANQDGRIGWQENEGGLQQAEQHANIMKKGEGLP